MDGTYNIHTRGDENYVQHFCWKSQENKSLWILCLGWEDEITLNRRKIECREVVQIKLAQSGVQERPFVDMLLKFRVP
jgi:hypothetical protein